MASQGDQEQSAPRATVVELEAGVLGDRPELSREEALRELARRRWPERTEVLARLVADGGLPAGVRATAAISLGDEDSEQAREALGRALQAEDAAVVRRAAASLGRIGDERSLDALERITPPAGPAARSVDTAKTLLSYRLGVGRHRFAAPQREAVVAADPRRSTVLPTEPLDETALGRDLPALQAAAPAVPLVAHGALRLRCGASALTMTLTEDAAGSDGGPARLAVRDAVVAVVFKHSACPDGWYVSEYVVTHPGHERGVHVFGVRPSGSLWHYGTLELTDRQVLVRLDALDTPYGPPLHLEGAYSPGERTFRVARALVSLEQTGRHRPAPPTPSAGPVLPDTRLQH